MTAQHRIRTCLWFATEAEEATRFYVSLFDDGRIHEVVGGGDTVMMTTFELAGQQFMALNGASDVPFTDAASVFVSCETQAEVDRLWDALTADGGEPGRCGWLKDRFGVSWQIIPSALPGLLGDPDPERAQRVMEAMLPMSKIDVAQLEAAAAG